MKETEHEFEVIAPPPGPKLEPVTTARLKRTLIHPDRVPGYLGKLMFSPDGVRLVAGHYPGGTIQTWNVETGSELARIETGDSHVTSAFFHVGPGWDRVYVTKRKAQYERIEKDGKKLLRRTVDGDIRSWNLETGEFVERWQHLPPRNIVTSSMSPDRSTMFLLEEEAGEFEQRPRATGSLWDVKTKQARPLPAEDAFVNFSQDGKTLISNRSDDQGYSREIVLLDAQSLQPKVRIPAPAALSWYEAATISPDGKFLVGSHRIFPGRKNYTTWQVWFKCLDTATGKEVLSFAGADGSGFVWPKFSPDGRTLYVCNWREKEGKLLVFDLTTRQLAKTLSFGTAVSGGGHVSVREQCLSPDGQWLAVITQAYPEIKDGVERTSVDTPQSHVHLIDTATLVVNETLVAPQGYSSGCCFSPNGKLLATSADNKVLLWDLSVPPGERK